ncbi:MAG TPA: NUDIX domain-containing protein [Ferruginibacter sp.]|nr:NUDIX domain-containing protein [Ferruginibacter sp.]
MQIKIYFGEKPVYLCDEINKSLNELIHHPDVVFIDELSTHAINALLHEIKKEDFHAGIIWNKDIEKLKKSFFKHFTLIEAAGGIVQNADKEILFIFRRGKWDLPKGKLEKKESPEICADREIKEETGLTKLTLKKKIGETYHTYDEFGKHFMKVCHWYYFTAGKNQTLQPQAEEDITEIKWWPTAEIKKPVSNTYANIKDILSIFFDTP